MLPLNQANGTNRETKLRKIMVTANNFSTLFGIVMDAFVSNGIDGVNGFNASVKALVATGIEQGEAVKFAKFTLLELNK